MNQNILLLNESFVTLSSKTDITLQSDRFSSLASDYGNLPIYRHFEQYAQEFPESIAITFGEAQISYGELNSKANQLANYLISQNVKPQDAVGVFVDPGSEILVAILAIHKINAVYVPIDTEYPLGRIKTIVEQVAPAAIICASDRFGEIDDNIDLNIINLPALDLSSCDRSNLDYPCSPDSISHIFFTSGTTGTPKGVVSSHSNLIHYIFAAQEKYRFGAEDSFLSATRFTFSISLLMLLLPLVCGGRVNIITLKQLLEPNLLAKAIERSSFFHLSPSLLKMLLDYLDQDVQGVERFNHVKHASSGGDMIPAKILNRLNKVFTQAEVYAIYGSSEISCMGCTYFVPKDLEIEQTLVGKPFNNVQLRVLDQHQRVVPVGVKGEIYFSGQGITQGYLNLPNLTEEKYILLDGERFYRTGDIGRLNPQGDLQMLGREDNQVQIRGMRLELGEIEFHLSLHPAISNCVVIAKEDHLGEKQLIAYSTTRLGKLGKPQHPSRSISQNEPPTSTELRNFLQETLPQYMIPSHFAFVEKFPLNLNGKVDRRALSALALKVDSQIIIAPRTATEQQLATIWKEVLNLEQIGIEDNFFELGGHSLLATQVISRIRETFQVEVSFKSLFETPTILKLSQLIEASQENVALTPILPLPRNEQMPLSFAQQRLWFLDQLESVSGNYNIPLVLNLTGKLEFESLQQALNAVIQRHEVLRTSLTSVQGISQQEIAAQLTLKISRVDCHLSEPEIAKIAIAEASLPFNLSQLPLLRATLLDLSPTSHVLIIIVHHIIADGWSMGILREELSAYYQAIVTGTAPAIAPLPIQYADFTLWQRQYLTEAVLAPQLDYWQHQLADIPPVIELPLDRPRPAVQTFAGGSQSFQLSPEISQQLKAFSGQAGVTLFMTLLSAFGVLMHRYTHQEDIVIGSPIANRNRQEIEPLIGFFVNTLALRLNFEHNPSFTELVQQVKQVALDAYAHQDVPFEKLVEKLQPERDLSYHPLFQVMFVLQNTPNSTFDLPELIVEELELERVDAKFDLTLLMTETEAGLQGTLNYKTDLFDAATITRMLEQWQVLLNAITFEPETSVATLPLLTPVELDQLLVKWNQNQSEDTQDKCIHELFEEQVRLNPNAVAVVFQEQQLTYQELNQKANQLAHYLQALEVQPKIVGICIERSLEVIIAILGIIKAGSAYLPLNPKDASERLRFIFEDASISLLLTQEHLIQQLPVTEIQLLCLDSDWDTVAQHSTENLIDSATPEDLAYVIYTSGSTGKPKGAMIEHRSAVNLSQALNLAIYQNYPRQLKISLNAPTSFDGSVKQIIQLINGHSLYIIPEEVRLDINQMIEFIRTNRLDVLDCTPSYLKLFLAAGLMEADVNNPLQAVLIGGEAIDQGTWDILRQSSKTTFYNVYGPTECTVNVTVCPIVPVLEKPTIGRSLADTEIYILDANLQPVPLGVKGELYLGGIRVARGYLNRPELTAQKFIVNPFSNEPEARLYKTGDLARYLADGNIEYLGRIDNQVKVRGFRIELGEIANCILQHQQVKEVFMITKEDFSGNQNLVAYVVGKDLTTQELRLFLHSQLPDYMIPNTFVFLDALPLTPNGKIDQRALPTADWSRDEQEITFVQPRDEWELKLAAIWEQVLKIDGVGIYDNFFELGGHSMLALQLFAQIQAKFQRDLSINTLFSAPTVEQLASILKQQENNNSSESNIVPIQSHGDKPPFFFVHGGAGGLLQFQKLAQHIGTDQPFYGLEAIGMDGKQAIPTTVEEMATQYVQELRSFKPEGPYRLGGLCFGGKVALEMAQQLQAAGQEVSLLILFNTMATGAMRRSPIGQRFFGHLVNLARKGPKFAIEKTKGKIAWIEHKLRRELNKKKLKAALQSAQASGQSLSHKQRHLPVAEAHSKANKMYVPQTYAGKLTLIQTQGDLKAPEGYEIEPQWGWGKIAKGGLEIHVVPGRHHAVLTDENIAAQAEILRACLDLVISD